MRMAGLRRRGSLAITGEEAGLHTGRCGVVTGRPISRVPRPLVGSSRRGMRGDGPGRAVTPGPADRYRPCPMPDLIGPACRASDRLCVIPRE